MQGKVPEVVHTEWAHGPAHLFVPNAFYIVTARTYKKEKFFDSPQRLGLVLTTLFQQAERFTWLLQAWAVMANHYHFVAQAPESAETLKAMLRAIHSLTARAVNAEDQTPGRKVWYQYRDTCLTNERSYLARLHYVHRNPVKHGLVPRAEHYRWSSMGWFLQKAEAGFRRTVLSFPCDRISIDDDF
jgi:putative transposase